MDSQHHDSHENTGGFWPLIAQLSGGAFCLFALVAGIALFWGGYKNTRPKSATPTPSASAPAAAPAPAATAPAAPATAITSAPAAPSAPPTADGSVIIIKPDAVNPMAYDTKSISVKAGQPVKLTFNNDSAVPLQHNLVIGKIGTKDAIIALANTMMTQPDALSKGYIPESPDILWHTKLLNTKESETLEFTAPSEKGEYPYLCTFPGHSLIMNGVMTVE